MYDPLLGLFTPAETILYSRRLSEIMRFSTIILAFLIALPFVSAATIHGTVYNIDLNPVKNAKVELVNPHQIVIAVNGTYQFEVAPGTYTLDAKLIQNGTITAAANEQLQVKTEGDYVLDLILFPELGDTTLADEPDQINIDAVNTLTVGELATRIAIGVVIVGAGVWYFLRKKKHNHSHDDHTAHAHEHTSHEHIGHTHEQHVNAEEHPAHTDDDVQSIIAIIKQQGNRTTQKDIRKQTPMSEAKVSLIITELEHKGVIEKIKKGRANIIILKQ